MEAYLYEKMENHSVKCGLCGHGCVIKNGSRGICQVRENWDGILCSLVFGKLIARHIDPIEKKPLFHMMPGSLSYSIATVGCNFRCRFCQNADIAQMPANQGGIIMGNPATPEDVVSDALRRGCQSISYTYTEPTVYFEFAYETAKLAREKGIKNVFVSNGYMSGACIEMIAPYLDGANIDLKAYSKDFYKTYCGAKLEPVKESLKLMKSKGILVEVTTLLIPGLNDDPAELEALSEFLAKEMGAETPWHISRFHPTYQLTDRPPTPLESLMKAREIGIKAGLHYVYMGNVPGRGEENTLCHKCGNMLIERQGFSVIQNRVHRGACPDCGTAVYGIGL